MNYRFKPCFCLHFWEQQPYLKIQSTADATNQVPALHFFPLYNPDVTRNTGRNMEENICHYFSFIVTLRCEILWQKRSIVYCQYSSESMYEARLIPKSLLNQVAFRWPTWQIPMTKFNSCEICVKSAKFLITGIPIEMSEFHPWKFAEQRQMWPITAVHKGKEIRGPLLAFHKIYVALLARKCSLMRIKKFIVPNFYIVCSSWCDLYFYSDQLNKALVEYTVQFIKKFFWFFKIKM